MVKKQNGELFIFSANNLLDGNVIYFSKYEGWTKDFHKATKLQNKDIESIKNLLMNESINNKIINPYLVEIDSNGKINKLREKIRYLGPKLESQYNV